ncbi:hypothetical protein [Sphingobium yanoikuyae]|uniref:hypothetical protein n=1 Tax=Sphingobium yanoikuyae TaxID=13690 RepID=UPI0022DE694D|nr:hypothetical protein [Sphingobium yanoikuyae]WBQ15040.1 hypothetical protein PAE53_14000 [Sphingobium yanoikuyae]
MYDITQQAAADTTAIHIKGLDGVHLYADADKTQKVQIVIFGPGSKPYAAVEARQTNRSLKRMQDNDGKPTVASPEDRLAEQAEDLADITVAFENLGYPPAGGKQGKELFQALYADPKLGHIAQQVLKGVRDWGNFKPAPSGN